jgi:hypothetical protein
MADIIVGGSLKPNAQNIPTRAGELINSIEEIMSIPNPRVGMEVWISDEGKAVRVLSLKEKEISGVVVPNAMVDEWEYVVDKGDEAELLLRLQGDSENSCATTDPFVNLGNMRVSDLVAYAETIIENNEGVVDTALVTAKISGVYRAFVNTSMYEMKLNVLTRHDVLTQTITGVLNLTDGVLSAGTTDVITVERYFQNGNGWGEWKIVASAEKLKDLGDDISAEVTRATEAETELLARVQGDSENSNPLTDPFKFLGSFGNMDEAVAELDKLHSTFSTSKIEGVWRFHVGKHLCEVKCFPIHYATDRWMQVLESPYRYVKDTGKFDLVKELRYRTMFRMFENPSGEHYTENNSWSQWNDTEQNIEELAKENSAAISAETIRATEAEQSILNVIPRKRNYITVVGNEAFVISKYNAEYDIIVQFAHTMKNELYSIKRVYLASNTGEKLSTDHTRPVAVLLSSQEASDMIGPVAVRTTGGSFFVGGNHLYPNQEGVKSAKTNSYAIYADDKAVSAGSCYADTVTIKVRNTIFDPAEVSLEGQLSSPLIEECTSFAVDCGEISIAVEHRYMKDVSVGRYYGMQSMFTKGAEFITAQGGYSNWKANEETRILKGDTPLLNRFSQRTTDGFYQNTVLLPYGLGTHEYVSDEQEVFIWTGAKAYHVLIRDREIPAGAKLAWMGVYNWNTPIVDDENNYIYTYKVDGKEFVSITAKQTYSNVSVAMPTRLSNTLYRALESDENITLNDIITSNLVLSATTQGSLLGTCSSLAGKHTYDCLQELYNTIDAAMEKGRTLAKRDLFIAAGALYNDTDAAIERTAPWGESVQHLAGHYYLNGLGDITEKQMLAIYNRGYFNDNDKAPLGYGSHNPVRTNLCRRGMWNAQGISGSYFAYGTAAETLNLHITTANTMETTFYFGLASSDQFVGNAPNLRIIDPRAIISTTTWSATAFEKCLKLEEVRINILKSNIVFKDSPALSKASVLYLIQKAKPTTAITITLHADAYARLESDADIVAALEAQPLITLVSA